MLIELKVPELGESITEVEIGDWLKRAGEPVAKDEPVVSLESEKATVELPAPDSGTLKELLKQKGQTAAVGEIIAYLEKDGQIPTPAPPPTPAAAPPPKPAEPPKAKPVEAPPPQKAEAPPVPPPAPGPTRVTPAAARVLAEHGLEAEKVTPTGPGGRLLKEDVLRHIQQAGAAPEARVIPSEAPLKAPAPPPPPKPAYPAGREEEIVPMTRLRRTIAQRLVQAQNTAALLTTFNEVDMSAVLALRKEYGEAFQQKYKIKLGFMSFFVKACVEALKAFPQVNAEIRDDNIVYHNYYDIGVAIGGGKGLVVPVLRNAERMSFSEIELAIADLARRARDNKLLPEELEGGTFTITNGGIYGSLLSTPIINPPQSGILGMHVIQERPVAHQGAVVIRPMMYVALTYDHRLVDGREAVSFLRRIKEVIETPSRLLLEI